MKIDIQFAADKLRQLPGANRFAGKQALSQESQYIVADLVGTARSGLRRRQAGNTDRVEASFRLVVGWPRNAMTAAGSRS